MEKPDDCASSDAAVPSRRGFFRIWLGATTFAAAMAAWVYGAVRFLIPNAVGGVSRRFRAGRPADYPAGRVETRFQEKFGVWVIRDVHRGQPQIYALKSACTHLGCITVWRSTEGKFKCPCHGSAFRLDGSPIEGPAPRPLERCAIRVAEDGQIEVDAAQVFREERGQWADPASFISIGSPSPREGEANA